MPKLSCKIDYKSINRMIEDLQRLSTTEVNVGFDDTLHSDGNSLADIANWMENGVRDPEGGWHTEPRRFMSMAQGLWADNIDKEITAIVTGSLQHNNAKVSKNLDLIGEEGKQSIQDAMDSQQFKKLSPTTLRLKRAKNARYIEDILFESGKLYEDIVVEIK